MIRVGDAAPAAIYVGDTPVARVYAGDEVVWEAGDAGTGQLVYGWGEYSRTLELRLTSETGSGSYDYKNGDLTVTM